MAHSDVASVTHRFSPILHRIPGYRRDWLLPDVLADLALWAVMVPEGMAYGRIIGVPPIHGPLHGVPALLAYALLGTSRQFVVGPNTATGLIAAVTGAIATQGTASFRCCGRFFCACAAGRITSSSKEFRKLVQLFE